MDTAVQWPRRVLKGFGFANVFFAVMGFFLWLSSIATFFFVPHGLLNQDLSYFTVLFWIMAVCNFVFLVGLLKTGVALVKTPLKPIFLCNVLFCVELVYFFSIKFLGRMLESPFIQSLQAASGIGNMGIALQMVILYPVIALIVLNLIHLKFGQLLQEQHESQEARKHGDQAFVSGAVTVLSFWFMLGGLLAIWSSIFAQKYFSFDVGIGIQVSILENLVLFVLGFFLLKRKEWARKGVILLTAFGLFWALAYSNMPYFQQMTRQNLLSVKKQQAATQQAWEERMEIEDVGYYTGQVKEMFQEADDRAKKMDRSVWLKQLPVVFSFLWFLFIYYFLNRPKVKGLFSGDPDIGAGGRRFIRIFAVICVLALVGSIYLSMVEARQNKFLQQGQMLMAKGDNAAALQAFTQGVQIPPGNGPLFMSRGIAYRNMKQWPQAIQDYTKALWFEPRNKELFLRRGYAFEMMGNKEEALKDYDRALGIDPFYIQALINRGLIYLGQNKYQQSLGDFYLVTKHAPGNYDGWINIGCAYERMKRPMSALASFQKAAQIKPGDVQVHVNLAKTYLDIGEHEKAMQEANKAIELKPSMADAYRKRAAVRYQTKDFTGYAQDWMKIYELDGNSAGLYWASYGYYRAGKTDKVQELQDMIPTTQGQRPPFRGVRFYSFMVQEHSDGEVKEFDEVHKVNYERTVKDGKLEGPARDFNENGDLLDEYHYSKGLLNGVWKNYKSGQLKNEWEFKDDSIEGQVKQYASNAKLECEWAYANSLPDGPYTCYYPSGQVQWQGNYKRGFYDGIQKSYYENGSPWTVDNYNLGQKDGTQLFFDGKGQKTAETVYKDGRVIKSTGRAMHRIRK